MTLSLESIEEFKLTKPFVSDEEQDSLENLKTSEKERIWNAMISLSTNPQPKAAIKAKLSVASAHVMLHENQPLISLCPISGGVRSFWRMLIHIFERYEFRSCRNFFSHALLRVGDELERYKDIKSMYSEALPILEILIHKLQAGLADDAAWKAETAALFYAGRPEYGMDTYAAEVKAEKERQAEKARELKREQESQLKASEAVEEAVNTVSTDVEDRAPIWLSDNYWENPEPLERRHSWSHFCVAHPDNDELKQDYGIHELFGKHWM